MKTCYYNSDGQQVFDRTFSLLPFFFGLIVKAFVYSPLLLTGYLICRQVLPANGKGYYWAATIIFCAAIIYCILMILKGILLGLKWRGRWGWILVFGVCLLYTCIPPGIVVFDLLRSRVHYPVLNYLISLAVGYWVYTRYHFLTDLVPAKFWLFYSTGLRIGGWRRNRVQ